MTDSVATSVLIFGVHAKNRLAYATTDSFCPDRPRLWLLRRPNSYFHVVVRPSRLRITSLINSLVTLRHDYHNGSTTTKAAPAFLRRSLSLSTTKGQTALSIAE